MEYANGGSLRSVLKKQNFRLNSPREYLHVFCEMARGMRQIHSRGIMHGDIKPDNFLVIFDNVDDGCDSSPDNNNILNSRIVVADLGLARKLNFTTNND